MFSKCYQLLVVNVGLYFILFRTILIANNVMVLSKEVAPNFSASDVAKIKKFSRQKTVRYFNFVLQFSARGALAQELL